MPARPPTGPASAAYVWLASNVFSLVLAVAVVSLLSVALLVKPFVLRVTLAGLALALGLFMARVMTQAPSRQRIYRLLERRFAARGVAAEDLKRFLGEPCLVAQAGLLLARWHRLDLLPEALRLARGEGVLFFAHPTAPIEDELNFPEYGPENRPGNAIDG